jgi:hypothetical protein
MLAVQDMSCWGSGGVPQLQKSPKSGGHRGLNKTFSELSVTHSDGLFRKGGSSAAS